MNILKRFWRDRSAAISPMMMILLTTVVALGAIVGLATLRDQMVQEFGDLALALENLNQSYTTSTSTFTDPGPFPSDQPNAPPACLDFID